jgi:signal transduction histidine kinase
MQQLVADLLTYSRVGSQGKTPQPVSVAAVLQRVQHTLRQRLRESGGTVQVLGELPQVLADELQLEQLLQNLVGNALKFHGDAPPLVQVQARLQQGRQPMWEISVQDNGIGIEPQYHERIFQMFQRLHERGRFEGSGIGLAVAQRIVQRHGGQLRVRSEPGRGSCFSFTLQAAPPDAAALPPPPAEPG